MICQITSGPALPSNRSFLKEYLTQITLSCRWQRTPYQKWILARHLLLENRSYFCHRFYDTEVQGPAPPVNFCLTHLRYGIHILFASRLAGIMRSKPLLWRLHNICICWQYPRIMIKGKYPDSSHKRNRQIGSIQLFTGVILFFRTKWLCSNDQAFCYICTSSCGMTFL